MKKGVKPKIALVIDVENWCFANISNAKKYLGYDPKFDLKEGLAQTIEWYKEFFSKE